ncbi:MAG: cytochrome c oxidase subunit II [Gammaproteobacteria bacterium]|nr:cytochrome c oxidase subunit II [Gammaproteobacteria bacterium]MBQ0839075.1 cytochrome c oxidase subunit II [Gammaproteobacteria bacterium]
MVSRLKQLVAYALSPLLLLSFVGQNAHAEDAHASGWSLLNMPQGVTSVSNDIYDLHMTVVWICVWISVVVYGVMFYSMFAHRKSKGYKAANFHESTTVELLWTIVPVLILIWVAFPSTKSLIELYDTTEADIDIKITGYQWKWQYEYLGEGVEFMSELTTSEPAIYNLEPKTEFYLSEVNEPLVLPVGKKVRFLLTAKDVIHSWWVPDLGVKRDAVPGFINETWAKIDEPGVYRGFCAELCGKGHAFMPIVVNAVSEDEYKTWLAEKKEAAAVLREMAKQTFTLEQLMAKGEVAYNRSCAGCHSGNGEGIPGAFPALKGSAIALGPVAKHLDVMVNGVSGTAMQAFGGQLSEVDLAAIITYERNAWGNNVGDMVQPIDVLKFKQGQ